MRPPPMELCREISVIQIEFCCILYYLITDGMVDLIRKIVLYHGAVNRIFFPSLFLFKIRPTQHATLH